MTCGQQAVFVLVWFCKREDLGLLGAGFGISTDTGMRPWRSSPPRPWT